MVIASIIAMCCVGAFGPSPSLDVPINGSEALLPPTDVHQRAAWMQQIRLAADWLATSAGARFLRDHASSLEDEEFLTTTVAGLAYQRRQTAGLGVMSTVVVSQPGRGRGLFYAGDTTLPVNTLVALYPCFLIRQDQLNEWARAGLVDTKTSEFWLRYATEWGAGTSSRSSGGGVFYCHPVGGHGARGSWFRMGVLDDQTVRRARAALNTKTLAPWDESFRGPEGVRLSTNGHIMNEPSGEERATAQLYQGPPCEVFESGLRVCGSVMEARTIREVRPGEPLTWCYGHGYHREYEVAQSCSS